MPQEIALHKFLIEVISVSIIIIGILVTAITILGRKLAKRIFDAIDRVPEKEWFANVELMMHRIPPVSEWQRVMRQLDNIDEYKQIIAVLKEQVRVIQEDYKTFGRRKDDKKLEE